MPYRVRKIPVSDLEGKRRAIGVKIPFSGDAVFLQTYQTKDALKMNILNYFLTSKGDRYMNPLFGNSLTLNLFENLTEEKKYLIREQISLDFQQYFPKVIIRELDIQFFEDEHAVQLHLEYEVRDTGEQDSVTVDIN